MLDLLFRRKRSTQDNKGGVPGFDFGRAFKSLVDGAAHDRAIKLVVIDTESTGVFVHRDRIIEIAIVEFGQNGAIIDEYCTLINPRSDLGPTNIHGIDAADACLAPAFAEVAGDILKRLSRAVVVGHNVHFDWQLLSSEFERLGLELPERPQICTMSLASRFGLPSRKLIDCCAALDINPGKSHSALDDARSTLKLFDRFRKNHDCEALIDAQIIKPLESRAWPELPCSGKSFRRRANSERQSHYLKELLSRLPESGTADSSEYCHALERALEDRRITSDETFQLEGIAQRYGLSKQAVIEAHVGCLRDILRLALADGKISSAERRDLDTVASLVGLEAATVDELVRNSPAVAIPASPASTTCDIAGQRVCFTGAILSTVGGQPISREMATDLASARGLIVVESVSKKTDILVLADPSSMSGKANKARQYGTRLMTDRVFWHAIGVAID